MLGPMRTWQHLAMLVAVAAGLATAAQASVAIRPAPGAPDPRAMVLAASELDGATVTAQGYYKDEDIPSVISYEREFESGAVGSTELGGVSSTADVGSSAPPMARFLAGAERLFGTAGFRAEIKKIFAEELGGVLGGKIQVGRPRSLGIGQDSFDVLVTVRVLGIRVDSHFAAFRVDRVIGSLVVTGAPGERVSLSVVKLLATTMAKRMTVELGPKSTVPPAVTGLPQVGQTLTASTGSWKGSPTRFAYQWQRCNAVGAGCVAVPGATSRSYVLADADLGSTMRVVVAATNAVGSGKATSPATAVVVSLDAPVNTAPPAISGTAQQGQTLTASTGSWTSSPTAFSFAWQRCDAAGAACTDVPGATAGTYLVTAADAGSTIRVAVTARNAAGQATAVSLPTAVVP